VLHRGRVGRCRKYTKPFNRNIVRARLCREKLKKIEKYFVFQKQILPLQKSIITYFSHNPLKLSKMNTKRIMTKIFSTTVFASILLFSQTANAQITLEHTFDGNIEYQGGQFLPVINLYLPYYEAVNPIRLYNEDYSLYKSITITPPANYSVSNLYL